MWLAIFLLIAISLWIRRFVFNTITLLHILQLEGYRNSRFIRWVIKNPKGLFDKESFITGSFLLFYLFFTNIFLKSIRAKIISFVYIFPILWSLLGFWIFTKCKRKRQKKPLVFTPRVIRLFSLSIFLCFFILWLIWHNFSFFDFFLATQVFLQIVFINLIFANTLIFPLEASINLFYLKKAERKMRRIRPRVIGIAGSYGKTSVKHIIGSILSKKYNTLITRESYNTLMGVCKVINNELKEKHQVFVVEMGAYKRGDIKKICKLVNPEIGVLTGIGIQHLERFKTLENIIMAKSEIVENCSSVAIINNDNELCRNLNGIEHRRQNKEHRIKRVGYGTEHRAQKERVVIGEDIEVNSEGTRFSVFKTKFKTRLLGRHNVLNILAGIAVALELKIEIEKIKEAVSELDFIPHRLQLIKSPNNVFILDDSYNSNPIGAGEALSCLSLFKGRRKILVTPGMIELGEIEDEENRKFGEKAGKTCDIVILVGEKRTKPIFEGLKISGFKEENIIIANSLDDAKKRLESLITPGDCVLFENDLPDNYE